VKRRRRVEVRIEHEELSIFSGPLAGSMTGVVNDPMARADSQAVPGAVSREAEESGLRYSMPEHCPICGFDEMLLLADAVASVGLSVASLKDGLEKGRYHLHRTAAGQWWVCGQSIRPG